jgi:hypothetical protein
MVKAVELWPRASLTILWVNPGTQGMSSMGRAREQVIRSPPVVGSPPSSVMMGSVTTPARWPTWPESLAASGFSQRRPREQSPWMASERGWVGKGA